jgi:hypothetical protein
LPSRRKAPLAPWMNALRATEQFDIVDTGLFALVRPRR